MMALTFWYDFASTYSYLSAMRIGDLAQQQSVEINWRPFLLGPIFGAQGWNDSPFNIYEAKGRYMWRDMERLAADGGVKFARPATFPQNSLLAGRIAALGAIDGWGADFTRAVYAAEFAEGREIFDPQVLRDILNSLSRDAENIIALATSPDGKQALHDNTDAAIAAGVFGAPTFTTADGELFWGNDRLENAIAWAAQHNG